MGSNKLCLGCMENSEGREVCPKCGYKANSPHLPSYLAPGTMLNERYLVGKVMSYNGEGATYIAYDNVIGCRVTIREYMPDTLCTRAKTTSVVSVNRSNLAQYKSLMSEFTELNKMLGRLRTLSNVTPSLDIFAANNTTYAVYEYIDGITLTKYLEDNAGELSWEQVQKLFPPLFTTLSLIHNTGIIHRGISPETIIYTEKGELKLTGFATAAMRTANSELASELYNGYAAPEQYNSSGWQGTWTDVYGICAVLYRILTGCMPVEALSRATNDNLTEPFKINSNVPRNISKVIMSGMRLMSESRIQTVTELVTKLFEQPSGYASEKASALIREEAPVKEHKPQSKKIEDSGKENVKIEYVEVASGGSVMDNIKVPLMIGALVLAIVIVVAAIICEALGVSFSGSDDNSSPSVYETSPYPGETMTVTTFETTDITPAVTTPPGNVIYCIMTNIVGKEYDIIKDSPTYVNYLVFEVEYIYDRDGKYPKGYIMWQEVAEGESYIKGSTVKINVSNGPATVDVPDYTGKSYSAYKQILDEMGIKHETAEKDVVSGTSGAIVGTDIKPGKKINLEKGEVLTVYLAKVAETQSPVDETAAPPPEIPADADVLPAE